MVRRVLAIAFVLLLAAPLAGCFVIDEIDKGSKFMDDHSPKKKELESEPKSPGVPAEKDALGNYFAGEDKAGTTKTFAPGTVSEGIVACKLGGSQQFMKREQCAARGGRAN
jgi:hypothetical protein